MKQAITVALDTEVLDILSPEKARFTRSAKINEILRKHYGLDEGENEEIAAIKQRLDRLEQLAGRG